jgi:hypothetical protein
MSRRARGYTVVELMMSLAVFATGITGIIAMQRATVTSNQHAKNLALATGIAQAWLSQLAADGTLWTNTVTSTQWLSSIATADGQWQLPAWNVARGFGAQFNAFGAPVQADGVFCAQIRLTWLYGDASAIKPEGAAGNGLIRSEVRVFWPRDGVTRVTDDCTSTDQAKVDQVGAGTNVYHFVVQAAGIREAS